MPRFLLQIWILRVRAATGALLALLLLAARPASAEINFIRLGAHTLADRPAFLTSGDFNRDGRADIVVLSRESNAVAVLLGSVTGELTPGATMAVGRLPSWAAAGDLNQDGIDDLAVADDESGSVFVLLGTGTGTFAVPRERAVGRRPVAVAIGDFDRRGGNDLAVSDRFSDRVIVLLNEGGPSPAFGCGGTFAVDTTPQDIVAADFNNDGHPDVATLNRGPSQLPSISVLTFDRVEDGLPLFTRQPDLAPGDEPSSLTTNDVDGDGIADLAVLNRPAARADSEVAFFHGRPGGIEPGVSLEVPCPTVASADVCPALALAIADFDVSGLPDLAVSQAIPGPGSAGDLMSTFDNDGLGAFFPGPVLNTDRSPDVIITADVTGDGLLDVVVGSSASNSVQVYRNVSAKVDGRIVGQPCFENSECIKPLCIDGVCCRTACPTNQVCNAPGSEGICTAIQPVPIDAPAEAPPEEGHSAGSRTDTCYGDCNYDGTVTLDEIVRAVNITMERQPVTNCRAIDENRDGAVTIGDLVRAVHSVLLGCQPERCLEDDAEE